MNFTRAILVGFMAGLFSFSVLGAGSSKIVICSPPDSSGIDIVTVTEEMVAARGIHAKVLVTYVSNRKSHVYSYWSPKGTELMAIKDTNTGTLIGTEEGTLENIPASGASVKLITLWVNYSNSAIIVDGIAYPASCRVP